jgi:leucyl/phenylalanyl-tRNA--protein transferase
MIPFLHAHDPFPPVDCALTDPNGLLAAGGDLSPARLIDAYQRGIFPWFGEDDPILWWSPDPRMVLYCEELRVSRSLRRVLRSGRFRVTMDAAFPAVMAGCAEARPGQDGTWITAAMTAAYRRLEALGVAHSVEAWVDDRLVGGLYGVALGRMFFGESMFARETDASKVAFVHLVRQLERWEMPLIDCQMSTAHLASLGAREIARADFTREVRRLVSQPPVAAPWHFGQDR